MSSESLPLIGHDHIIDFFRKSAAHGRLTHGYLLTGPASVGKTTIVETIARLLMCPKQGLCGSCVACTKQIDQHPDYIVVDGEHIVVDEEEKDNIPIETVRDVVRRASLSVADAPYKIIVILSANKMLPPAANAFLKVLEDPPRRTIFFLTAPFPSAVLTTIRSRLQRIRAHAVPSTILTDAMVARGMNQTNAEEITHFAHGLPGRAIRMQAELEELQREIAAEDAWRSFFKSPQESFTSMSSFASDRDSIRDALQSAEYALHRSMNASCKIGDQLLSPSRQSRAHQALCDARDQLRTNASPQLIFENFLLRIT